MVNHLKTGETVRERSNATIEGSVAKWRIVGATSQDSQATTYQILGKYCRKYVVLSIYLSVQSMHPSNVLKGFITPGHVYYPRLLPGGG